MVSSGESCHVLSRHVEVYRAIEPHFTPPPPSVLQCKPGVVIQIPTFLLCRGLPVRASAASAAVSLIMHARSRENRLGASREGVCMGRGRRARPGAV